MFNQVALIILAGGKSRRMGFDKQQLEIAGETIVHKQIHHLHQYFYEVIVVSNRPDLYQDVPVQVVRDDYLGQGPLAGIHAGLQATRADYGFVLACDMPHWDLDYLAYQFKLANQGGHLLVASQDSQGQIYPFHALYSKQLLSPLAQYLEAGQRRVQSFILDQDACLIKQEAYPRKVDFSDLFITLNQPDDLCRYQEGRIP